MTSSNTDWKLGETRGPLKVWITAEAQNAIEAGDLVMTSDGSTAQPSYDGNVKVWKRVGDAAFSRNICVSHYMTQPQEKTYRFSYAE